MPKRADELLADLGLVESRSKARALIEEGKVLADSKTVDKPSRKLSENAKFEILADSKALKFVSRAGLKIEKILDELCLDVRGFEIIDIGASTGGFTDCLLSRGAKYACCVDVGSGQLHEKLRSDPRVRNLEKTDARALNSEILEGKTFDLLCADLSFISLEKVVAPLVKFVKPSGYFILLVKPQFETPPELLRRTKGIIRDENLQLAALEKIKKFAAENLRELEYVCDIPSPIRGGDGNREFLLALRKK